MPVLIILLSQGCPTHAFNTYTNAFDYANTNAKVNASDYTNANAQVLLFLMPMLILKFILMFLLMFLFLCLFHQWKADAGTTIRNW